MLDAGYDLDGDDSSSAGMEFRRYTDELFPRIANVPSEENVYRIVVSDTPTVSLVRMTIWRQGLEAAKVRAEELLHSIVQIERDAVLQPQGDG